MIIIVFITAILITILCMYILAKAFLSHQEVLEHIEKDNFDFLFKPFPVVVISFFLTLCFYISQPEFLNFNLFFMEGY
jgi:hypothetical protein